MLFSPERFLVVLSPSERRDEEARSRDEEVKTADARSLRDGFQFEMRGLGTALQASESEGGLDLAAGVSRSLRIGCPRADHEGSLLHVARVVHRPHQFLVPVRCE
jgi:hypothetical protein